MRAPARLASVPASPRLGRRRREGKVELWTEAVGSLPPVYGERWSEFGDRLYRAFDPYRSKLAAALVHDWEGRLPTLGERWLYLGAASGTTASHVADLLGPDGRLYALERSLRPFARLLDLSGRWPNLLPILADARDPARVSGLVPPVDGLYMDIAQPDQLAIARENAAWFLRGAGSACLIALKTASLGRELAPAQHLARAEQTVSAWLDLETSVKLDPFHRAHYLLGGQVRPALFGSPPSSATTRPAVRFRGRPRR